MVVSGAIKRLKMQTNKIYVLCKDNEDHSFDINDKFKIDSNIKVLQISIGGSKFRLPREDSKKLFSVMRLIKYDFSVLVELTLCFSILNAHSDAKLVQIVTLAPVLREFHLEDCLVSESFLVRTLKVLETSNKSFNFVILIRRTFESTVKSVYILSKIAQFSLDRFHMQLDTNRLTYFYYSIDMIGRKQNNTKVFVGSQALWRSPIIKFCNDLGIFLYSNPWKLEHIT